MKRLILLLGIFLISFVFAYTAPSYNDINLVLGEVGTCFCPGLATNWELNLADYCNITDCNVSTDNITFIEEGAILFNGTLTANKIIWKDSVGVVEKYNFGDNFRGWVG